MQFYNKEPNTIEKPDPSHCLSSVLLFTKKTLLDHSKITENPLAKIDLKKIRYFTHLHGGMARGYIL